MLIFVVLGYAAPTQAQVNSSQQNGSKTGEWFTPICLLVFSLCCPYCDYDFDTKFYEILKSITEIYAGTGAPQATY